MAFLPLDKKFNPDFAIPGKKPVGGVEVDWSNSLSRGLIDFFVINPQYRFKGVNGKELISDSPAFTPFTISEKGPSIDLLSSASSSELGLVDVVQPSSAVTILMAFKSNITIASNHRFYQNDLNSAIILRENGSGLAEFLINPLTNDRIAHSYSPTIGETFVIGGSWGGNGTALKVITNESTNGTKITTNGSTSSGTYAVSNEEINPNSELEGDLLWVMFFDRQLTDCETRSIIKNPYQILKPATQAGYFTSGVAAVTSALTGTATATITETDITDGGKTIIVTLTGDTFKAAGTGPIGSTADTQALIDGFDAAASPTNGWNNEVRDKALTSEVVRTSSTIATWTISAQAGYDISAQETITGTIPTDVLVTGAGAITSTPTFTIDPVVSGRIMGSLAGHGGLAGVGGLAGRRGGMAG